MKKAQIETWGNTTVFDEWVEGAVAGEETGSKGGEPRAIPLSMVSLFGL